MSPSDRSRLEHMIAYAERAIGFLGEASAEDLDGNVEKLFAVARALEIVGEAASKVSEATRRAAPHIAWSAARQMRNRLIHVYPEIDTAVLVDTVRCDLPVLIADVHVLLGRDHP